MSEPRKLVLVQWPYVARYVDRKQVGVWTITDDGTNLPPTPAQLIEQVRKGELG